MWLNTTSKHTKILSFTIIQQIIYLKQRKLTPYNIPPSTKSTSIQLTAQHQSKYNKEKLWVTVSLEENTTYKSVITTKLKELAKGKYENWIIETGDLKEGINVTFFHCVKERLDTIKADTVLDFETYFFENEGIIASLAIFTFFKKKNKKNKKINLDLLFPKQKCE